MIISASRRTDIPAYYADWFINRIKDGKVQVKNPMNTHQISEINLSPDVVDCIVFWTKNPLGIINLLDELKRYNYYFQFTLNGYGRDIELNLPDRDTLIKLFKDLSVKIGKNKVIWRYDPILINSKYTKEYHIQNFNGIANSLKGYTERAVISFVDMYAKTKRNMKNLSIEELSENDMHEIAKELSVIAKDNNIDIYSCAEAIDLSSDGIEHGCCIDKSLIGEIIGMNLKCSKDKNQREICGCIESIDIGAYNTCKNGCRYCYANYDDYAVSENIKLYNPDSLLLCSEMKPADKIYTKKMKSLKDDTGELIGQLSIGI